MKPGSSVYEVGKENFLLARLRGDAVHLAVSPEKETYHHVHNFVTFDQRVHHMEVSDGPDAVVALHLDGTHLALYHTTSAEENVLPFENRRPSDSKTRCKYSKFLSPRRLAVATGLVDNSLSIMDINPDGTSLSREIGVESLDLENRVGITQKASVNAIAAINAHSPGNVFLAGWGDGIVRYAIEPVHQPSTRD